MVALFGKNAMMRSDKLGNAYTNCASSSVNFQYQTAMNPNYNLAASKVISGSVADTDTSIKMSMSTTFIPREKSGMIFAKLGDKA